MPRPIRQVMLLLLVLLVLLPLRGARADAPALELPVRCTPGRDCFIQNYVDQDSGPGWRDYACGRLAYDGHDGTDIRLLDRRQMQRGVAVLAAADGRVVAVRDGEEDLPLTERTTPLADTRAAGNGVRVDHGGGWETQYSHLRRGSIRVRVGEQVTAGQPLGEIGLSGRTEFPHLHLSVRHDGRNLDPFAPEGTRGCADADAGRMLWSAGARALLAYRASAVLGAGFADRSLSRREIESADYADTLRNVAPALVFHVEVFGIRAGDTEELALSGPDGGVVARSRRTLPQDLAVRRSWVGKRRPPGHWAIGNYHGTYRLLRAGQVVAEVARQIELR